MKPNDNHTQEVLPMTDTSNKTWDILKIHNLAKNLRVFVDQEPEKVNHYGPQKKQDFHMLVETDVSTPNDQLEVLMMHNAGKIYEHLVNWLNSLSDLNIYNEIYVDYHITKKSTNLYSLDLSVCLYGEIKDGKPTPE